MKEKVFEGIGVSEGIRIGSAFVFQHAVVSDLKQKISEITVEKEIVRIERAKELAAAEIENLIRAGGQKLEADKLGILKGQGDILRDPAYFPEIVKLIRKQLLASETATAQVTEKFALLFENMKSDYMKERATDVRDVGNRILRLLSGEKVTNLTSIDKPVILVADDLSPTDTIQLDKEFILGFATQKGGKTSHTSIFAKSLGIPAVVGISGFLNSVTDGETVIIDGRQGLCIVSPELETIQKYQELGEKELAQQLLLQEYIHKQAVTGDGYRIIVAANIGSFADAEYALRQGAEGVGLFRTEQLYLSRDTLPDENEQFEEYKKIALKFLNREVIVRTLDIGGDKSLSYLKIPKEENPFLGYRAIRLCLDRKELFITQLKAILRASAFGKLAIMFPMISDYDELLAAKSALSEAESQLKSKNISFDNHIRVGIMVEIPSVALLADVFAKEVDFFSIGTNDLTQYTLAVDRGNEKISYLYNYFNPGVIRLIKNTAVAAHASGIPVGMCGGMAGDPMAIPLLLGLDLDELSMNAGAVPKAKSILSKISKKECNELAEESLHRKSAKEIQQLLTCFYKGRSV